MNDNCRVEDLTLTLGGATYSGSNNMVGVYFGGNTTINAKLRTCVVSVSNNLMASTASNNVYGVQFDGTGSLAVDTFSFNCVKGSTVNVYPNGSGNKRGMIVTNTNIATLRDTNVYVRQAACNYAFSPTGSYVGIETADVNNTGSIQLRSTTVGAIGPTGAMNYTASDILQTRPPTIANPTYLDSAGIQVGPGVDLVTKTAGGKGFSAYVYPTTLFYGAVGVIKTGGQARDRGWMWNGTLPFAAGNDTFPYPDQTTPAARYRAQQPLIVAGLQLNCGTPPGNGRYVRITVCKNSTGATTGGAFPYVPNGETAMTLDVSGTATNKSFYAGSENFAAGDFLSLYLQTNSTALADVGIQVDCF